MTLYRPAGHRDADMSFREPASLDDSSFLGRIAAWLVERFVLPFTDSFATSAVAVLAVPVGCTAIAIAMLGAGILTFFLPPQLSDRVLAGGLVVGIVAAALLLLQARRRFKAAVRRTAETRLVRPVGNLTRDPRWVTLQDRVRGRVQARVAAHRAATRARAGVRGRSR